MKKLVLFSLAFSLLAISFAQTNKCLEGREMKPVKMDRVLAPDFTITDTDGHTFNLYTTLNEGKTVFLDFFFTTCGYCIQYSPIIEQVYQNHGAGTGDIVFWGLSDRDNNTSINTYKTAHNVGNLCAGTEGGGNTATTLYSSNFTFTGWPTYSIICPDKTVSWDVKAFVDATPISGPAWI